MVIQRGFKHIILFKIHNHFIRWAHLRDEQSEAQEGSWTCSSQAKGRSGAKPRSFPTPALPHSQFCVLSTPPSWALQPSGAGVAVLNTDCPPCCSVHLLRKTSP